MELKNLRPWVWFHSKEDYKKEFHPLIKLQNEIDRLFNNSCRSCNCNLIDNNMMLKPKLDIAELDKEYKLSLELPGIKEEDIKIDLSGDDLIIWGEKKSEKEEENKHFHRLERNYGSFYRLITLPNDYDKDKISATFENGILEIRFPKKTVKPENHKSIPIGKKK